MVGLVFNMVMEIVLVGRLGRMGNNGFILFMCLICENVFKENGVT